MPDIFSGATAWFGRTLKNHAARAITITDRAVNPSLSITLPASSGRSEWDESSADAVVHSYDTRDWLVDAADLIDAFGSPQKLRRGWIVTDSLDGQRYEIFSPSGDQPWRYSDRDNQRVRIHSRNLDRT